MYTLPVSLRRLLAAALFAVVLTPAALAQEGGKMQAPASKTSDKMADKMAAHDKMSGGKMDDKKAGHKMSPAKPAKAGKMSPDKMASDKMGSKM